MNFGMPILSYCLASARDIPVRADRRVPLPPPGLPPRTARLPGLAVAMAKRLIGSRPAGCDNSVFFGTALGCMTETQAFLENMLRRDEAEPMPRAFTSAVHNALASRISLALGARGESQTFVHAEVSFLHALFAAGRRWLRAGRGELVVGALDESTPHVRLARAECGWSHEEEAAEGGALLLCGQGTEEYPALARIRSVSIGRFSDLSEWLGLRLADDPVDLAVVVHPGGSASRRAPEVPASRVVDGLAWAGDHSSCVADATAIAVGLLSAESDPADFSLAEAPRAIAVIATTRFRDVGLAVVERAT